MTKTTPEKSKARENNEREEGSLTEMNDGSHAAPPVLGTPSHKATAKADVVFGPSAARRSCVD